MTAPLHVLIAGAGIAGLCGAQALLQRGVDVTVFEQAGALPEMGAGVQLSPNGSRVLLALGLGAAMAEVACVAAAKEVRLGSTGQRWPLFNLGEDALARFGAPYWLVHRGDFHQVLLAAVRTLKPDAVRLGQRALRFEQDEHAITLITDCGQRILGDALLAADGVHSALRQAAFGAGPAEFTGLMAWARGRFCVIGDAAHPTLPLLADPLAAAAYIEREWAPELVRQRYDWLLEHDVTRLALRDASPQAPAAPTHAA